MLEAIVIGKDGREVILASMVVIRDATSKTPLALVKSHPDSDGITFLTARDRDAFVAELRRSVFSKDLAEDAGRLPNAVKEVR